MVFFELKDHSKESREKFIASCEKFLSGHEGSVYFSVGTRADDVDEPVSVKDFDVALHVVFANKEAKAKYLESPGTTNSSRRTGRRSARCGSSTPIS